MTITISALYTYPIKSCGGIRHDSIALEGRGLRYDRHWMVVDTHGEFITQREAPALAIVQPAFVGDSLVITAPGCDSLRLSRTATGERWQVIVWDDHVEALDMGEAAARWFSAWLGRDVRLVRFSDDVQRLTKTTHTPNPGETAFSDGYPLLVVSEASLDDLNQRLRARGKDTLPMARFRPNVVVTGCEPFAEDTWRAFEIGGVLFEGVKLCARCAITTVDQATGTKPQPEEPLQTLATFRKISRGVLFGQNVIHRDTGTLRVGDAVTVREAAVSADAPA